MKPIVDGLERSLQEQATVLRIDLGSQLGRAVAREYGVTLIPALLVFDRKGKVTLRQMGLLQPQAIRRKVADLNR
jgi:hypothetical protein